jgi:hypothetical protein
MAQSQLPSVGSPNTSVEEHDDKGNLIRRRFYGKDGLAIKNIDYSHDHGAGKPHAHDWDWAQVEPRQAGRRLKPGE